MPEVKDSVNVLDDTPELLFSPEVNGKSTYGSILPFYVSLHIHDKVLHNAMFDLGTLHNLMPKAVMEKLNLDVTRPYKDLFSFDSIQVKCLGLIKDLCVSLVQFPYKTILMDVVVTDIPTKYGMLLSRSWGAKLQGSLQLDLSYATISVFGQPKRLYRETLMKYVVNSEEKPQNFPIYSIHSYMDSFILFNDDSCHPTNEKPLALELDTDINEESVTHTHETVKTTNATSIQEKSPQIENSNLPNPKMTETLNTNHKQEITWYLEFDGSVNKLGAGAGIWIHNTHNNHAEGHAYKVNFKCTNNMAEYEALLLGLKLLKVLGATKVSILGDSDLIIQQMKRNFVTNDNTMRAYRTVATNILNAFTESKLANISRNHNIHAHSLATFANTCKLPFEPNHHFTAEIKHRPVVPNNVKDWQVFESDEQINNFLTLKHEFSNISIDMDIMNDSQQQTNENQQAVIAATTKQILHPTIFNNTNIEELKHMHLEEIAKTEAEIMDLKDNFLPAHLTPLEDMFDANDVPKKPKMEPLNTAIEEYNIGTAEKPKIIKLSNSLPPNRKPKYVDLFKEF